MPPAFPEQGAHPCRVPAGKGRALPRRQRVDGRTGGGFNRLAIANGASPLNAANAQWAFTVTFGYLPNVLLSMVTFSRRGYWKNLLKGPVSYWIWAPVMAFMWIASTALYGAGANLLGDIGPVIGWPIYMSMSILAGVFWGWMMGEWGRASRSVALHLIQSAPSSVRQILFKRRLGPKG